MRNQLVAACLWLVLSPCLAAVELGEYLRQSILLEPNSHLQQLGEISDDAGSLARTFFSPAHKLAAAQIKTWMEEAGMESWIDVVGNVHGRINGSKPDLPAVIVGSHYDTVLDAGKYDGNLGIITAISAVKTLLITELDGKGRLSELSISKSGDISVPVDAAAQLLPAPVRIVGFTDEEGVRFQSTFLGSRALAGNLEQYHMLDARDKSGATLREVLSLPSEGEALSRVLRDLSVPSELVKEYIEVHIEQGPVLERKDLPLGVVSAIAGQTRLWLSINGTQGHAGTVPMRGRGDTVTAAAEVILFIERRCGGGPDRVEITEFSEEDMLVCTVGEIRVWPGASNVIAGNTQLSIDIRSKGDALRNSVVDDITTHIHQLCAARGVDCSVKRNHDAAAVLCDGAVMEDMVLAVAESYQLLDLCGPSCQPPKALEQSCSSSANAGACKAGSEAAGSGESRPEVPVIVSGAGHDAMAMAEMTKMGMMFVRNRGGISHSPLEHVEDADVAAATAALTFYLKKRLTQLAS